MSDAPLREIFTRDFLMLATINLSMFFGCSTSDCRCTWLSWGPLARSSGLLRRS